MSGRRAASLLRWYRAGHRDLPWRQTTDPYRILVSEVMLQQTRATRVAPYYERFLDKFPDVEALAAAPLPDVLRAWSGLGYNRRAKRLHDAAGVLARDGWPETAAGLQRLPGVGPYTAAAVASFAFGERIAAVDTNVRRVLSRWHGAPLRGIELREIATVVLRDDAATWNQALMELGATVCRPRDPSCDRCPVQAWCRDPGVYEAPRPQGAFEGSRRQRRGAVVRALMDGPLTRGQLEAHAGVDLDAVLRSLCSEGLVEEREGRYAVAGISEPTPSARR